MMKNKLNQTKEEIRTVMSQARDKLDDLDFYGPYGHNIISLILRDVANKIGTDNANELIFEYDLEELGIMPVRE